MLEGNVSKTVPFPRTCETCFQELKELYGCGYEGLEGKGTARQEYGSDIEPYSKTCPRYYWNDSQVQEIFMDLEDYKRGSLGNVLDLPAHYLEYLRIAENEKAIWKAEQDFQINKKINSD